VARTSRPGRDQHAARHPERIVRELTHRQEEWLAAVCAQLRPDDEYAEIVKDTGPEGNR
jgi:hypothetical protein